MSNLILIVDDREDDQLLLERRFRGLGVLNPIRKLGDGIDAIRYFKKETPFENEQTHPMPAVLCLDLQMPQITGWQVLEWLRRSGMKRQMWIFVYSDPKNVDEVRRLYSLGANSFLRKPIHDLDLLTLIHHYPTPWSMKPTALKTAGFAAREVWR